MSELVADCPRCAAKKITFDLLAATMVHLQYRWQRWYEAFCVCRHCSNSTVFVLAQSDIKFEEAIEKFGLPRLPGSVNDFFSVERYISQHDRASLEPPEHVPEEIGAIFKEGAKCLTIDCCNAAGTMFRLCVDMASTALLPATDLDGLNSKIRRSLGLRLVWLFDNKVLPESLRELSHCIKEDGNDGAHAGTLTKPDAEDLLDFTVALLERLYTEPRRLEIAKERRNARRNPEA